MGWLLPMCVCLVNQCITYYILLHLYTILIHYSIYYLLKTGSNIITLLYTPLVLYCNKKGSPLSTLRRQREEHSQKPKLLWWFEVKCKSIPEKVFIGLKL